jgi:hypothetical protein
LPRLSQAVSADHHGAQRQEFEFGSSALALWLAML